MRLTRTVCSDQSDGEIIGKGSAMKIERHETGPRMSKAVIHGDTIYLAGIVADSPKVKSWARQTKNICRRWMAFSHWRAPTRRGYSLPTFGSPTWQISLR